MYSTSWVTRHCSGKVCLPWHSIKEIPPSHCPPSFLSTLPISLGSTSPTPTPPNVTDRQTDKQTYGHTFLFYINRFITMRKLLFCGVFPQRCRVDHLHMSVMPVWVTLTSTPMTLWLSIVVHVDTRWKETPQYHLTVSGVRQMETGQKPQTIVQVSMLLHVCFRHISTALDAIILGLTKVLSFCVT